MRNTKSEAWEQERVVWDSPSTEAVLRKLRECARKQVLKVGVNGRRCFCGGVGGGCRIAVKRRGGNCSEKAVHYVPLDMRKTRRSVTQKVYFIREEA